MKAVRGGDLEIARSNEITHEKVGLERGDMVVFAGFGAGFHGVAVVAELG